MNACACIKSSHPATFPQPHTIGTGLTSSSRACRACYAQTSPCARTQTLTQAHTNTKPRLDELIGTLTDNSAEPNEGIEKRSARPIGAHHGRVQDRQTRLERKTLVRHSYAKAAYTSQYADTPGMLACESLFLQHGHLAGTHTCSTPLKNKSKTRRTGARRLPMSLESAPAATCAPVPNRCPV